MRNAFLMAIVLAGLSACEQWLDDVPAPSGEDNYFLVDNDGDGYTPLSQDRLNEFGVRSSELRGDDCNDADPETYPGAEELCDGVDNDCDGVNEEEEACACLTDEDCDNGLFCDGAETCDAVLGCQPGTPPTIDDGISCTDDSCDEDTDTILNVTNDALCDNGLFCDGAETCDAVIDCQAGTPPVIDDGVSCTDDSCDEDADTILNEPIMGCCWTDEELIQCEGFCTDAEPLPVGYICGCSIGSTPADPGTCTTCEDADEDLFCVSTEVDCTNLLDDDGDGLVDCEDLDDCGDDPACLEPCLLDVDCEINEYCADGGICTRIPGSPGPYELWCVPETETAEVWCSYWSAIPDVQVGETTEATYVGFWANCPERTGAFSITAVGCTIPTVGEEHPCCSTQFGSGLCDEFPAPPFPGFVECPWRKFDPTL